MNIISSACYIVAYGFCITLGFMLSLHFIAETLKTIAHFKRWLRKKKIDRRVIRQAKAAGVWDNLRVLGGRALELRAWDLYNIKRNPGETDACLRMRCKEKEAERAMNGGTT